MSPTETGWWTAAVVTLTLSLGSLGSRRQSSIFKRWRKTDSGESPSPSSSTEHLAQGRRRGLQSHSYYSVSVSVRVSLLLHSEVSVNTVQTHKLLKKISFHSLVCNGEKPHQYTSSNLIIITQKWPIKQFSNIYFFTTLHLKCSSFHPHLIICLFIYSFLCMGKR